VPLEQTRGLWGLDLELLVAASGPLTPLVAGLPRLLAELDPEVPLRNAEPLAARVDRALARPRLLGASVAAIGALALLLAGVGVFALASYSVSRRRLEFGLRQALGATPAAVLREVLRQALGWGAVAAAGGLPLAALGARLARSLLFRAGRLPVRGGDAGGGDAPRLPGAGGQRHAGGAGARTARPGLTRRDPIERAAGGGYRLSSAQVLCTRPQSSIWSGRRSPSRGR
jgi:hypothetical protein